MLNSQVATAMDIHDLRQAILVEKSTVMILPRAYPLHVDWLDIWYWKVFAAIAKVLDGLKQD